ncbi:MAG: S41 family peptidase [Granulicatella adiacens]|nr:S41 family peptidase [Granulicatella adiacens]
MGNNPKPQGAVQNGLESKKVSVWILFLAVLLTGVFTYFGTSYAARTSQNQVAQSEAKNDSNSDSVAPSGDLTNEDLKKLELVYDTLVNGYVDKNINKDDLINGALKGMAEATGDPYTNYLVNDETAAIDETMTGSFGGIGAELRSENNRVIISNTREGTPSQKIGLQENDVILKVDGEDMEGKSISYVVSKVRGEVGTDVTLTIQRGTQELEVKITRAKIAIETVKGTVDSTDSTIGHVQINSFAKNTAKEVEKAVTDLREKGVKKFIFDVRYNPGGLLDQAIMIANMFLDEGKTILNVENRDGQIKSYKASKDYGTFKITEPYVLLVNEGSASASEILAAALKESADAKLIGTKTYGKGTVQSVIEVGDNAELKYTIAKWLTPNKTWIHKTGIEPTEEVSMPDYYNITIIDTREVVKEGAVSDNVKTIEKILKGLGYDVTADGYFDSKTTEAVKEFQKSKGLSETGEVDEKTGTALMSAIRDALKANDTQYKAAVKALQ